MGRDIALRCPRPRPAGGTSAAPRTPTQPACVPRLNGAGTPQRGVPTFAKQIRAFRPAAPTGDWKVARIRRLEGLFFLHEETATALHRGKGFALVDWRRRNRCPAVGCCKAVRASDEVEGGGINEERQYAGARGYETVFCGGQLPVNRTLVGTSRCDVPARAVAGGTVAQRAVPTKVHGPDARSKNRGGSP